MSSSAIKQFGRAWQLTVSNADGNVLSFGAKEWEPEALHITFDTRQTITEAYWFCDVTIYNLNSPTQQGIILQGMSCKVEAGYQSQPYGTIFEGTIFQPLWERENGVDWKLTLRCICGLLEVTRNFVSLTIAEQLTQRQIVARIAAAATYPLDSTDIDTSSTTGQWDTKQSRQPTYFGQPNDFLQAIADDNNSNLWFSNMALHIRELMQDASLPTTTYSPSTGLVGTPQMTQDGVLIKVLLDARVVLRSQVKLDQSVLIRQFPRLLDGNSYPTVISQSGTYLVGMVRHYGDSRGNDWYSEITGFVNAGSILALQTQN